MNREEQFKFIKDNYPATTHHISKRKIRHEFFKNIQTEIQAYLLGFYVADGSVDEKRKTFRIQLSEDDKEMIDLYRQFISNDARIFNIKGHSISGRNGEKYQQKNFIGIDITSQELTRSLVDLGYGYRKTYKEMHLPNISDNLIIHFIRGYFDGDGSFSAYYVPEKNGRKETVKQDFTFHSRTNTMLLEIQKFFSKYNINFNLNYRLRDNMYVLGTSNKQYVKQIFNLMFKDSNFYLSRKYNKIYHHVNTEVTQLITEYRNAQKVSVSDSNNPSKSAGHPTNEDENVR